MWLNEGVAMVSVDRYFGKQTVKNSTLKIAAGVWAKHRDGAYPDFSRMKHEEVVYHYARGYCFARFLQQCHPDLLQEIMSVRQRQHSLEKRLASVLGCSHGSLWQTIDNSLLLHFGNGAASGDRPSEADN